MIDDAKRKISRQRKLRWHTPREIMCRVYNMGGMHWDAKEEWIKEAVRRGGTGAIMCGEGCDVYKEYGFGAAACRECAEAWRELPDGTIEYWTD